MSVAAARKQAFALFEQTGLPTTRNEHWKYTDISRLQPLLTEISSSSAIDVDIESLMIDGLDAYRMVFVDGIFQAEKSDVPDDVSILSLADFLNAMEEQEPEQVVKLFEIHGNEPLYNGLMALNAAKASDGTAMCVADGIKLDKALLVLHIGNQTSHIRHAFMFGKHAQAEIIEHFIGTSDNRALSNISSNIILKDGASCQHYRLQLEGAKQSHFSRVEVKQLRDSSYRLHSVELGALLSRVDIVINLAEQGASCELNGLFVLNGRQHVDHHTRVDHVAPHCVRRENYRTVLDGRSHGVFNGKVVVHEGAVKTDSSQSNGNLLLSKNAEIDTKPELEIYNDDVKCAHGATVGQLDDKQLFYLRSRGVSEEAARELLTFAFADEVLASMDNPIVRRYVEHAAFAKLPHGKGLDGLLN